MSTFEDIVLKPAIDARNGNVLKVPLHLDRIDEHLSMRKRLFTLIGSNPGSGKTAFVDDVYVLSPYETWRKHKHETDIKLKTLYVSGERPLAEKLAKWACWKLYRDYKIQLSVETFLGFNKIRANQETWDKFVECKDWVDELLDYVDIKSGIITPDEYGNWIKYHANAAGTTVIADTTGIKDSRFGDVYQAFFTNNSVKVLDNGEVKQVINYVDKFGKTHEVFPMDKLYIPNDPKLLRNIVYDHIGKNKGAGTKKDRIDLISQHSAEARDLYGDSPILISQFNRAIGNIDRAKHFGTDLAPILDDFKDSSNTQEDADIILALFNPFRYKAFDDRGMYRGYDIKNKMMSPYGFNRFRLLTILKNSYGIDDASFGLKFLGEVMTFQTLPKADQVVALNQVYSQISNNL